MKGDAEKAISTYLKEVSAALARGDASEHTYRPALQTLVEALNQGITCTNEPRHVTDAGHPDMKVSKGETPLGFIETKDVGIDLDKVEKSEQMVKYLAALPNLILTDYLEFRWYQSGKEIKAVRLVVPDRKGKLRRIEGSDEEFLTLFDNFLKAEVVTIASPKELAQRMASLAKLVRTLIAEVFQSEQEEGDLHQQLESFRETLIPDLDAVKFADMYAQTICYGLFAGICNTDHPALFARENAADNLPRTNPFLRKLFHHIVGPDLNERVKWAVEQIVFLLKHADISAILRDFGKRTRQEDPVVHFYETFLSEYDPKLRKSRGVYYTPEPVVSYIVRSVDHILKEKFDKPLGLADPTVLVLDPACGTGTFLHAAISLIHERVRAQGQYGTWSSYVRDSLLPRIFGFELLMAPYAVAHLKLGLLLQETGYDFSGDERLGIYLTNTLEEAAKKSDLLFAQWIADESNAAAGIKRDKPVMVVLGNPPYSGHSANKGEWIGNLVKDYYQVDGKPLGERNPKWLQDDYVKFIRWGQWRIERTGSGVLAFISNNGYLDNPTFRGMRQQLLRAFSEIHVLNLHGSSKKKEAAPDGSRDENVFDIQQGVAIGIFSCDRACLPVTKNPGRSEQSFASFATLRDAESPITRSALLSSSGPRLAIAHADLWGEREAKYRVLLESAVSDTEWHPLKPATPFYLLVPQDEGLRTEYDRGWRITEAMPLNVLGFQTHRDHFAVDFDEDALRARVRELHDQNKTDDELRELHDLHDGGGWSLSSARERLRGDKAWESHFIRCLYRPFDWRPCYFSTAAMDRPRRELLDHVAGRDNLCLGLGRQGIAVSDPVWSLIAVSVQPIDANVFRRGGINVFPLYLYPTADKQQSLTPELGREPNQNPEFIAEMEKRLGLKFMPEQPPLISVLSPQAGRGGERNSLSGPGAGEGKGEVREGAFGPEDVFAYIYAIFHSPTYRKRYAEFLKIDFPRVPLTSDRKLFRKLGVLGAELVALHLMESPKVDDFVTKYPVKGSDTVENVQYDPNKGRVGINKGQYFSGIKPEWWNFHIGGYQVLQKWLKDRKGRKLSNDDLRHYQRIVVAIRGTIRLMTEIDQAIPKWPVE
jgi:predicted helicase